MSMKVKCPQCRYEYGFLEAVKDKDLLESKVMEEFRNAEEGRAA